MTIDPEEVARPSDAGDTPAPNNDPDNSPNSETGTGDTEVTGSISEALLSTEPDEKPADHSGLDEPVAHIVIGTKKALNGLSGKSVPTGTPAVVNFALGVIGMADQTDDESSDKNSATTDFEGVDS